jgi:hypothetical protein
LGGGGFNRGIGECEVKVFAFANQLHMLENLVRKTFWLIFVFCLCGWLAAANAETYEMTDGTSVTGDIISFNDDGVIIHTPDDKYTDRLPWTQFSQDGLKTLAQNHKIAPYAEPFIEAPAPTRSQMAVSIHDVERLDLPPQGSVIGGLFTSSIGIILLLLIYAANVYAGVEVAVFRSRPVGLVAGVAAVLPILGPIVFLSMPTVMPPGATEEDMETKTGAPPEAIAPPQAPTAGAEQPAGAEPSLHITATAWQPAAAIPETQVFKRGQFTFNRRFFETKFSNFFGMSRHGVDKDMILTVKTSRAQQVVERITRISSNEAYFEVSDGAARQEVMVSFADILEMELKHKNA